MMGGASSARGSLEVLIEKNGLAGKWPLHISRAGMSELQDVAGPKNSSRGGGVAPDLLFGCDGCSDTVRRRTMN